MALGQPAGGDAPLYLLAGPEGWLLVGLRVAEAIVGEPPVHQPHLGGPVPSRAERDDLFLDRGWGEPLAAAALSLGPGVGIALEVGQLQFPDREPLAEGPY